MTMLGFAHNSGEVVASGLSMTLRCANRDCNQPVAQCNPMGILRFKVLACPSCGRGTEFQYGPDGWTVVLLAGLVQISRPGPPKSAVPKKGT